MRLATGTTILAIGVALAGTAMADEPPSLLGTWKGKAEAVYIGPTPYRTPEDRGVNFGDEIEVTYVIGQQEGARFAGETSGKFVETVIGALRPPEFTSGVMLDDDGTYEFTLRDADTLDACYSHLYPTSKVVVCFTLVRQP